MTQVLITPEAIDSLLSLDLRTYETPDGRAALRGALGTAAALCDKMASEVLAQNTKGRRRPNKEIQLTSAAFKRAGDEIWRMRDRVAVPAAGVRQIGLGTARG